MSYLSFLFLACFFQSTCGYIAVRSVYKLQISRSLINYASVVDYDSSSTIEDIRNEVEDYISIRNAAIVEEFGNLTNGTTSADYVPIRSPLEMFRARGWYRDEKRLDFERRSDKRIPKVAHPLAFAELQRFGYDNLYTPIMMLGGPHEVGVKLGLGWTEPVEEEIFYTEEQKIAMTTTYGLDTRGELKLGLSMNMQLEEAAELDMSALKNAIKMREMQVSGKKIGDLYKRDSEGNINYEPINPIKVIKKYVNNEVKVDRSEKFTLDSSQRAFMVLIGVTTALGHGRASHDLVTSTSKMLIEYQSLISGAVDVASILSNLIIIIAIGSSGYSIKLANEKKRNPYVWGFKSLLGGPLSVKQLQNLDNLI
jgi:hypothetical protein